ncbi:ThiF family adenylyltransferase [Pleomorphomonas sp. NRK KF1]|uniref:ThiF family adenylyltransferase n=1 Tax=Pleomorphomonas sp. NRK KF1 TaxID=2943000 RepID=UPI002043BE22|nr:ThiF family adenylyltransferase [Pleomorphomonas sp. NRK KF1]MCM5554168.1 ThiF family adenylyltransferase [Pleomorphomonas sp. NRK KF1]
MTLPHDLAKGIDSLPEKHPRFELAEGWTDRSQGMWSFRFRARLSTDPSEHMPLWSGWHLVVAGSPTDREIRIYPDAIDGIVATFPHQDFNGEPTEGRPWRTGKPCLERPAFVFRRDGWSGEPQEFEDRLVWYIGRLLRWIDAAAQSQLLIDGDPLELPMLPTADMTRVLGFRETIEDLVWWEGPIPSWGFAGISQVPGARSSVVSNFMGPDRRSIRRVPLSSAIPVDINRVDAVWFTLPALVVFEPWRTAASWAELTRLCASVSVDLPAILSDAGARLRRVQRLKDPQPIYLLVGFPLEEALGGPPQRFHWLAIQNMQLCRRTDVRRGFSGTAAARRAWDAELATSARKLDWVLSANWAPDQLRRRGEAENGVRAKTVLVLGCGTLGAAIAENLVRMGVTQMGVLDCDTLQVGNLSRHILTMTDVGHNKAVRLASRLNMVAPDSNISAFQFSFPPSRQADIDRLKGWDVVIDCTASDAVLRDMATFEWMTERVFISLSMTWGAKGLFAYTASETAFPVVDATERFRAASAVHDAEAIGENAEAIGEMEGIGCWHPVFPASADDVNLWAAVGSKFIRGAILKREKTASLYLQMEDGSVERRDIRLD